MHAAVGDGETLLCEMAQYHISCVSVQLIHTFGPGICILHQLCNTNLKNEH